MTSYITSLDFFGSILVRRSLIGLVTWTLIVRDAYGLILITHVDWTCRNVYSGTAKTL